MRVLRIDHVQLAMPPGREDDARAFYAVLLGLAEVAKPEALAGRGGVWFGDGEVRIHLGVEAGFRPARKAHPALLVHDLPALVRRLRDTSRSPATTSSPASTASTCPTRSATASS
jgi:catechol 2,3-dioxygenase-like lactoylglutathione lyase family enzyme